LVLPEPLLEGRFVRRYKRFLMDILVEGGDLLTVHCPNSGSMEGCLEEGALVVCTRSQNLARRLAYTAECILLPSGWVGLNTHRANLLVGEALRQGRVPELAAYREVKAEVPYGRGSRVDFLLTSPGISDCYVEVKNTTWPTPDGGVGFPDAVTERGLKHLRELRRVTRAGGRAVMFYLVNREGGCFFRAAVEKHPEYARELRKASKDGVEVLARRVRFALPRLDVDGPVAVVAGGGETLSREGT
jgi:sugar fermentation stimulation protein A